MGLANATQSRTKMDWLPNRDCFKNDFDLSAVTEDGCPCNANIFLAELEKLQRGDATAESVRGPTDWKSVMRKHREVLNISLDPPETERILLKTKKFVNACLQCCKEKI